VAEVIEDRLVLAGREVWITRPADSEALLTEEAFAREEFLPYWADLWPSAIELAHTVETWELGGRSVLELGCGLALPGIAAALRGGRVTVSDWAPDAMAFAEVNARRNGVELDVLEAGWAAPERLVERAPWDLVLAADVLYEQRNVDQLLDLLPRLVDDGRVVLADPGRIPAERFLREAAAGWHIETVRGDGSPIRIHTLVAAGAAARR
jgi:predicted nicotinamide N-methyase